MILDQIERRSLMEHFTAKRNILGVNIFTIPHSRAPLLQTPTHLCPESNKLWEVLLIVVVESLHVLGVGAEPVHTGEMFPLSKLLVKTPEYLGEENVSVKSWISPGLSPAQYQGWHW